MYGEKLKKIRKHLSVTQDSMSELLNISSRSYASYERNENNPPYSMLVELCKNYNINLNWFNADIGEMFIAPQYEDVKGEILAEVEKMFKNRGL